jgi:hypothetical protein
MLQQIDTAIAFAVVMLMLSLLVTAVVQSISALTDLRGRNLASGLQNLLQQIEPEFRKPLADGSTIAKHLAAIVVRHPAIAHAGTRAKAVSQGELVRVLRDLGSDFPAARIDDAAKAQLQGLLEARVPGATATVSMAHVVAEQLGSKYPALKDDIKAEVDTAFATVSKLEDQVSQWFDTIMDRLSDIFTRTTRVITVGISVALVLTLQIDSGEILRQISHSPELRAKLTAMSDSALLQADKLFDNGERATAAMVEVKKIHSNRTEDAQIVAALEKVPPHLTRCLDGRNSLVEKTKNLVNAGLLLEEFDKACQDRTRQAMGSAYDEIRGLRTDLEKTDLRIVPMEVGQHRVFDSLGDWCAAYRVPRHLAGTLVSVLLLSLGAPFWYNALRQLANLKPAIAGKISGAK